MPLDDDLKREEQALDTEQQDVAIGQRLFWGMVKVIIALIGLLIANMLWGCAKPCWHPQIDYDCAVI